MTDFEKVLKKYGIQKDKIYLFGFDENTTAEQAEKVLNLVGLQGDLALEDTQRSRKGIITTQLVDMNV